jgi:serine/threonine protein kinase
VLVAATVLLVVFLLRRKKELTQATKKARDDSEFDQAEMGDLPLFSYRELEQATNYFDEKRELGGGGYGKVYLGKLRDGRSIAVKRFHENNGNRFKQFVNEVKILSSVRHCNLVRLFGCCKERENLLLVCEYVPNGTLFDHLHGEQRGKNGLRWDDRLKIALETASALAYLHFDNHPPIFHRDVKIHQYSSG